MKEVTHCRLTGAPLVRPSVLLDMHSAPLPGLYVSSEEDSLKLRAPLRVIQSEDGFVQLGHHIPTEMYSKYGFAGGQSAGYRQYLSEFASKIRAAFPSNASIFEIGCGDGTLLDSLQLLGYQNVAGMDPSPQAELGEAGRPPRHRGYFPSDLPDSQKLRTFDCLVCRHVLEHIETPNAFVAAVARHLSPGGEFWVEVPDLASAVEHRWWTNFYALHCNYFEASTLDALMARHGLECISGEVVDVFGGSLLRSYRHGSSPVSVHGDWRTLTEPAYRWRATLDAAVNQLPLGSWGWGAAERTASALAYSPALEGKLSGLVDGNTQLHGKFMAGTRLRVHPPLQLEAANPPAVVVFALSYAEEIIRQIADFLPAGTPVLVPADPVRWTTL